MFRLARLPVLISLAASATLSHAGNTVNKTAFLVSGAGTVRHVADSTKATFLNASASGSNNNNTNDNNNNNMSNTIDKQYPGTAVDRMLAVRARVAELTSDDLNGPWEDVRRKILWAGGLRDLPESIPGQGYTGHAFNDYNHVDLTCMAEQVSHNQNDGSVREIAVGNQLGPGIRVASLPELGPGGSWSTCANGSNQDPPQDVAHIQFRSRIAFKLVWLPTPGYDTFVLVDDDGKELGRGTPTGSLPDLRQRQANYVMVQGSKYSTVADVIANKSSTE